MISHARRAEDLILHSVDDHLVEPPDMFDGRLASRFADRAPRVIENDLGREMWLFERHMADEVQRLATRGVRAFSWSENPEKLGVPSFHNLPWDPFWRAADDAGGCCASTSDRAHR